MPRRSPRTSTRKATTRETTLRIVGGSLRGSKLKYAGDPRVRPMKDRVREALFNLLGPAVEGSFAVDLFGGTGALALEAISRGAKAGLILERHRPTAQVTRENIEALQLTEQLQLVTANTFHWFRGQPTLPQQRWTVFCSPPYRLFTEQQEEMLSLLEGLWQQAPDGSLFAVEATREFDFSLLPNQDTWDVRDYPPATLGVARKSPP